MESAETKALNFFNEALKSHGVKCSDIELKETARFYAMIQVSQIINALYEVTFIDSYTPHKSIIFYNKVLIILKEKI